MNTIRFFLLLLIAPLPDMARGQSFLSPADSNEAAVFLAKFRTALTQNQPDSAAIFEKNALAIFKKNEALAEWYFARSGCATHICSKLEKPLDAVNFIHNNIKNSWREPKTTKEWKAKIRFNYFGGYYAQVILGDYQLARTFYEENFEDFTKNLGAGEKTTAYTTLGTLANVCTRLGDYERARILLKQQADIAFANHDLAKAAASLHDLAIVFRETGQIDASIALELRALAQPEDPESPMRASYFSGLAGYFLMQGNIPSAEAACRDARSAHQKLSAQKREWASFALAEMAENEARIHLARRQFAPAKAKFEQSLWLTIADFGGDENRREVAKIRIQIGDIELLQNRPQAALPHFQKALQNVIPGFFEKNVAKNPLSDQFYPENTIREALDGKARAWQLVASTAQKKAASDALQNALDCHVLIEEIEQRLRETYQFQSSNLQALDEGRARLERATGIAHALFLATADAKFAEAAFLFCEKSKGLLLLQGIARGRSSFKLPPDLRSREQELNGQIARLEKSILEKKRAPDGQTGAVRSLEDELLRAKQAQQKFWEELKSAAPEYWKLSKIPAWAVVPDLPKLLEHDQVLVEYLVGENQLFVFQATADGQFSMRKTILPPDFLMKIDWLRQFLGKYDPSPKAQADFAQTSFALFKLLLGEEMAGPVFSSKKRLLIVPDGVLGFVPFEVLLENLPQNPASSNWAAFDFLLKKKTISYAWSASLLREQLNKKSVAGLKNFAAFVPDYSLKNGAADETLDDGPAEKTAGSRDGDGSLPGAKAETDAIEKLIGGRFFRGKKASRANFLHWAGQFRTLHLAMHAVSDADDPAMSRLIFSREKDQPAGANLLYINDLQQVALNADLAVLSACKTGGGRLHRGEGVFSLARGFALSGVSATLMSLWQLSDESTPELMSVFYEKLKKGERKDDALGAAKLDWLTGPSAALFKHPYFWAGMVANGNMRPVDVSGGGHFIEWMVFIFAAAAFFWWFSAKYRFFSKLKSTFIPN